MHCTNGIVIQVKDEKFDATVEPRPQIKTKRRSFTTIPNEVSSYISKNRNNPTLQPFGDIDKNMTKFLQSSKIIDFIWIMCSAATTSLIPNWTGFNFLLHDKGEEEAVQTVTYLPAINQSPTNPDTVLELLIQSKAKAEHLGLEETDVVVDQAIYAKAVEILANPHHTELRKFIVLCMGAFHIASTFITVIGKRFSDAGLQDLLIEANIFGKNN